MAWTAEQLLTAVGQAAPRECITEARMAEITGLTPPQVEHAALKLRKHGFLTKTGQGCHKLTAAGRAAIAAGRKIRSGPNGPETGHRRRDRGLRQRVWNALRSGKKLTVDDLIMRVAEGGERDPRSNVRKYLVALARAGYVRQMPVREPGLNPSSNGCVRWWLVKDTGPIAPVWRQRHGALYDGNSEEQMPLAADIYRAPKQRPQEATCR
jgi:hypothetical protein